MRLLQLAQVFVGSMDIVVGFVVKADERVLFGDKVSMVDDGFVKLDGS